MLIFVKDHLGNVRVVVKDVKEPVDPNTRTQFYTHYKEISDYYPFGMLMEGRNWQSYSERYGYNGMEQEKFANFFEPANSPPCRQLLTSPCPLPGKDGG